MKSSPTTENKEKTGKALLKSEQLYHATFQQSGAVKLLIDPGDGAIIDANASAAKFYGYSLAQLKMLKISDINILPAVKIQEKIASAAAGQQVHFNFRHRLADGEIRDVEVFSSPIEIGGRTLLHSIIFDVTERKMAEQAVRENEIIFSAFLEHSPVYVFFKDKELRLARLSKNYEQMLGMPISAAIGKSMDEVFPADLARSMEADDRQVMENGKAIAVVEEFAGRTLETTKFPILINGIPSMLAGFTVDVTERKRAEEAFRQAEAKYRDIFENALEGIFQSSPDGHYITVNAAMARIFGYSSPEDMITTIGSEIKTRIYANPDQRAEFMRIMEQKGFIKEFEAQNRRKDGGVIWTKTNARTIRDARGVVLYYEGFLEDISERKHIEEVESAQRALAEALRDTASALNNTLTVDDVLDCILLNVGRVAKYDVVYVMQIDAAQQVARVVRQQDTRPQAYASDMAPLQFSLAQTRNLREMLATGTPIIIADTLTYPDWILTPYTDWIRSNLNVPIKIKGEIIGFLGLDCAIPNAFSQKDIDHLQIFADQAANAIENAQLYENVQKMAITDALTGVFNRRGLFQLGEREVERALRFQRPLSLVMLDIDHFKVVNDRYGHSVGDRVLGALAACCHTQLRNVDLVARYGGEEFILLLTETDLDEAARVAERLRGKVENMQVPFAAQKGRAGPGSEMQNPIQVTVSLGVVALKPDTPDLADLLSRVDRAMYSAKSAGRNRVAVGE